MIYKLTDKETIRIAHKSWPKILNQIKQNRSIKLKDVSPLSISDNRSLNIIRPYVSIKTNGCIHHLRGGCSMCSFNIRRRRLKPNITQLKKFIDQSIKYCIKVNSVNKNRYYFGFGSGGSFFDRTEFPQEVRLYFYKRLKEAVPTGFCGVLMIESRLEFINEEIIVEAKNKLGNNFLIALGYGLESTNKVIREACIHKRLPPDWREKINILKQNKINRIAHILVKPPFLNQDEAVDDAVKSVRDVFNQGFAESVIVMVMAIKKNTAVEILKKNNKYILPSIWSIIEIIRLLGPKICRRVTFNGFAWTNNEEVFIAQNQNNIYRVKGCEKCSPVLMPHLLSLKEPNSVEQWQRLMDLSDKINCECKNYYSRERSKNRLYYNLNWKIIRGIDKLSKLVTKKDIQELIKEKVKI